MTRINIGINPRLLTNKHLIAEHREIKRIPNTIKNGKAIVKDIPREFTLGKGHVKFFYNKLRYLYLRYKDLHDECIRRDFKVSAYHDAWNNVPFELFNDYKPTKQDIAIIMQRLREKDKHYDNIDITKLFY